MGTTHHHHKNRSVSIRGVFTEPVTVTHRKFRDRREYSFQNGGNKLGIVCKANVSRSTHGRLFYPEKEKIEFSVWQGFQGALGRIREGTIGYSTSTR